MHSQEPLAGQPVTPPHPELSPPSDPPPIVPVSGLVSRNEHLKVHGGCGAAGCLGMLLVAAVALIFIVCPKCLKPGPPPPTPSPSPPVHVPTPSPKPSLPSESDQKPQPSPEPASSPSGGSLDDIVQKQVGRFTLVEAQRIPAQVLIDERATDGVGLVYNSPDGTRIVHGLIAFPSPNHAQKWLEAQADYSIKDGFMIASREYGRDGQAQQVNVVSMAKGEKKDIEWTSGRLCYLLLAPDEDHAKEFLQNLPYWQSDLRVKWQPDLYSAYVKSNNQRKPLVVYFYQGGCDHCERLETDTLSSKEVNALADQAVFARINFEADDENKNVSNMTTSLQINGLPTTVVLDVTASSVVERGRIVGYYDINTFVAQLKKLSLTPPTSATLLHSPLLWKSAVMWRAFDEIKAASAEGLQ